VLLAELEAMGSLLADCARATAVPAGGALAVDREAFSRQVTQRIQEHPGIQVIREEVRRLPQGPTVVASGPLTSPALSQDLARLSGEDHLYFFDAISPIVEASSIDFDIAFRDSRYGRGVTRDGDYINCPMEEGLYRSFVAALKAAERIPLRSFEQAILDGVRAGMDKYFEGCLPVEVIAERGDLSLAYGPLRPVGLTDPRTGRRPFAAVQLRQDDLAATLYNLVGFQTNLRYPEQRRVFRMIPGLEQAQFARYGQMHRNTFLNSPRLLLPTLQFRGRPDLFFAGQLTGVEGYLGNIGTGLLAGLNAARWVRGEPAWTLPRETMLGALCHYVAHAAPETFQPMKANLGILPALLETGRPGRRGRAQAHAARSRRALAAAWPTSEGPLRIAIAETTL
jgi:methylenetetrahydrofolate--tRNA-(uracil-5-)-methyltransferase